MSRQFPVDAPEIHGYSGQSWATRCKVRQWTVTPPRKLMPGSIPGSPTTFTIALITGRMCLQKSLTLAGAPLGFYTRP